MPTAAPAARGAFAVGRKRKVDAGSQVVFDTLIVGRLDEKSFAFSATAAFASDPL